MTLSEDMVYQSAKKYYGVDIELLYETLENRVKERDLTEIQMLVTLLTGLSKEDFRSLTKKRVIELRNLQK